MPTIIENQNYIEISGHYDDKVLCAKLTLLANLFAVEHRNGYAKFQIKDKDKLELINDELEFLVGEPAVIAINGGWGIDEDGTEIACYGGDEVDITSTGIEINGVSKWTASPPSGQSFLGFSMTEGATTPNSNLEVGDSITLSSGHTYRYTVYGTPTSSLNDLTGTKWVFHDEITGFSGTNSFAINFISNNTNYIYMKTGGTGGHIWYSENGASWVTVYDSGSEPPFEAGWTDEAYKTIEITGGSDATNSDLIAWLQANATQQIDTSITFELTESGVYKARVCATGYSPSTYSNSITYPTSPLIPYDPVLGNNDWATIQMASKNHNFPSSWQVGDTKTFVYNGVNYQARLVDTTGKYRRVSDNSIAYLKFELTEVLPDKEVYNSNTDNNPLNSQLLAKINSGTIYNKIDSSLTSVIEPVKVEVSQGGGSSTENTLINYEGKFFLHREHDLNSTRYNSVYAERSAIERQDEYYQLHNTNNDRLKYKKGGTSAESYCVMSPYSGGNNKVCAIDNFGSPFSLFVNTYSVYFALCFAL